MPFEGPDHQILERVLAEFVDHYNSARPHRGISLDAPIPLEPTGDTSRPVERVDRLGAAINKITQSPDIVEKFATLGALPRALGPKEFGAFLESEDARWSAVVKSSGVKIE